MNSPVFLGLVALDILLRQVYLGFPASSAPVERLFSTAGNVLTARRVVLGNDIVSAQTLGNANKRFREYMVERESFLRDLTRPHKRARIDEQSEDNH